MTHLSWNWIRLIATVSSWGALALLVSCGSAPVRSPAAKDPDSSDRVRVAVREIPSQTGGRPHRLLLLGIDRKNAAPGLYRTDLSKLGFSGDQIDAVEPRFLITLSPSGPVDIRSFDITVFRQRNARLFSDSSTLIIDPVKEGFPMGKNAVPNSPWQYQRERDLPTELIRVGDAQKSLILRFMARMLLQIGTFVSEEFAPIGTALLHLEKSNNSRWDVEAQYLQTLISSALDDQKVPALREHLSDEQLRYLGAELSIRYHRESDYAALLKNDGYLRKLEDYDRLRGRRRGIMANRFAELVQIANLQGFVVREISPYLAIVLIDRAQLTESGTDGSRPAPRRNYSAQYMDPDSPEDAAKRYQDATKKPDLIPYGIFALNESKAPLRIIDFDQPLRYAERDRLRRTAQFAKELGYTFIPSFGITLSLKVVEAGIQFVIQKQGKTIFDSRVRSYGELQAILESGIAQVKGEEVLAEAFLDGLVKYGLTDEQVGAYREAFRSGDRDRIKTAVNEALSVMGKIEERQGRLFGDSGEQARAVSKALHVVRLQNFLSNPKAMASLSRSLDRSEEKTLKMLQEADQDRQREKQPAFTLSGQSSRSDREATAALEESGTKKPLILILADGLRPDRLQAALEQGRKDGKTFKNLRQLFDQRGLDFTAFGNRSLTLPSWATILTGFEIDQHGLKSNSPASRGTGGSSQVTLKNYLDYRKELFIPKYIEESRSYRHLKESGIPWLPRYYPPQEALLSYLPINDGAYPPLGRLLKNATQDLDRALYGSISGAELLDQSQADRISALIREEATDWRRAKERYQRALDAHRRSKRPSRAPQAKDYRPEKRPYRLVVAWFSSIDDTQHTNSQEIVNSYRVLDDGVGKIIAAAQDHPVLKDAYVVLVSDHGHRGGPEADGSVVDNTGFNLIHFFAGDFRGYEKYQFNVGASESPEPRYDLGFLKEFLIQPFSYHYPDRDAEPNLLIDYSGDNLAQVYLKPKSGWGGKSRASYADLLDYVVAESKEGMTRTNLIEDLLNFTLRNSDNSRDPKLQERISQATGNHPVEFFAMALSGETARLSADVLGSNATTGGATREPVLVQSRGGKTALILTRTVLGQDLFRYLVLKNFKQDRLTGAVSGEISSRSEDDPLGLLGSVIAAGTEHLWLEERQLLRLAVEANHPYPTALASAVRQLTLADRLESLPTRVAEIPDFILVSSWGHSFNSSALSQSDHGGWSREESQVTFRISGLGEAFPQGYAQVQEPILTRDIAPTLLDIAGYEGFDLVQGRSQRAKAQRAFEEAMPTE